MALNSFLTPRNNEYKKQIYETRYMSKNEVISDKIKMLMDIDIIRDIANKNMKLNPNMPYDLASISARQEYLGEPVKGIDIPIIIEEEQNSINNDDNLIEEEILNNDSNVETSNKNEFNEEDTSEDLIEDNISDTEDLENTDELLEINDLNNNKEEMLSLDNVENVVETIKESYNTEEKHNDLIDDITNEYNVYSTLDNTLLDHLPIETIKTEANKLENNMNNEESLSLDSEDINNKTEKEKIEEKLSNTLTNGLSIDFLDEPVLQKIKKR